MQTFFTSLSVSINSIIAIDPAGALFTYPNLLDKSERVDAGDAKYVQAIHTSIVLGSGVEAGHADFYIDGGISQPGCATKFIRKGLLGAWSSIHSQFPTRINIMIFVFAEIPTICNHFRAVELFQLSLNPQNSEKIVGIDQSRDCAVKSRKRLITEYCDGAVEILGIRNHRLRGRFDFSTIDDTLLSYRI